ncbi:MAG: recombinase family protein, partial [Clostridia bacterium]|nr:recombinase family protein [Clostridia bacterium]
MPESALTTKSSRLPMQPSPEIDPEQAAIVIRIYREFINGASCHAIAKGLTADGIPTPGGK